MKKVEQNTQEQGLYDELVNHVWTQGPNTIAGLVWTRSTMTGKHGNKVYSVCCETKDYEARFFPSYEAGYKSLARVIARVRRPL